MNEKEKRKYLMDNFLVDRKNTNFFHQNKQAQKLLAFFPDIELWKWLNSNYSDLKVYTLVNLLKPDVLRKIRGRKKVKSFHLKAKGSYDLLDEKVGEDLRVEKSPPNTILEFLKNGSKKEEE